MALFDGGRVTFSIIGAYCEDYINDLLRKKIRLKNIRNINNMIYADTDVQSYPSIAKASRKYGVRVRIASKSGRYHAFSSVRKRPGLVLGIIVSSALVLFLRLFIWHIDVHGNNGITDEQVLGLIEGYGFTAGAYANATDALSAERKIMLDSEDISWINIEVNGSRADVYLSENTDIKMNDIDPKTPCNIVAARSGVIVDTDVTSGKLMYEKGSGVAQGSVIVSGAVSSGETLILVHSDAEIIAEFTDSPEFSMSYTTVEKVPSEETFTHRQLMILGIVIPLDSNDSDTSDTFCTEKNEQLELYGLKLPLKMRTEVFTKYTETSVTRSADDIRSSLERSLELYMLNFLKDYEILSVNKTFSETEDGLALKADIKLKGDIAVKKPIFEH